VVAGAIGTILLGAQDEHGGDTQAEHAETVISGAWQAGGAHGVAGMLTVS
jgi:hypothetical protein